MGPGVKYVTGDIEHLIFLLELISSFFMKQSSNGMVVTQTNTFNFMVKLPVSLALGYDQRSQCITVKSYTSKIEIKLKVWAQLFKALLA